MNAACYIFRQLSTWTWERLKYAQSLGMSYGEETITEHNLLLLKRALRHQLTLQAFTHSQEALNGADWEWWIGKPGRWYGMRVQAKRMYYPNENFPNLYSYKTKSAANTQINTLIARAQADNIDPVYCIYVGNPAAFNEGCQIACAHSVKTVNSIKYAALKPIFYPWQNLVCDHSGNTSPADPATRAFRCIASSMASAPRDGEDVERRQPTEPREALPSYLEKLRKTGADEELENIAIEKDVQGFMILDLEDGE